MQLQKTRMQDKAETGGNMGKKKVEDHTAPAGSANIAKVISQAAVVCSGVSPRLSIEVIHNSFHFLHNDKSSLRS